jgi:hypothetical protein
MSSEERENAVPAPDEPLFAIDLEKNGGYFSPTSPAEMHQWLLREQSFWSWSRNLTTGNHGSVLQNILPSLDRAVALSKEAIDFKERDHEGGMMGAVGQVQNEVGHVFIQKKLPHSTSVVGHRIEGLKHDRLCAVAYVFSYLTKVDPSVRDHPFDSRDVSSWRGFLLGMV